MIQPGYARGGEIASKLAKLVEMLRGAPEEAATAMRAPSPMTDDQIAAHLRGANVQLATNPAAGLEDHSNLAALSEYMQRRQQLGEAAGPPPKFTATGREVPRDDQYERLQSLVTNQPTDAGQYQWAVKKPGGGTHGAPFDFKGSALRIADHLNQTLPGHTVEPLSIDNPAISRYAMRTPDPEANPFKKATAEEIDALLSQNPPEMAKGGDIFSRLRQLAEQLGDKTATVSDISGAREQRGLKNFHSNLMQSVQQRMADRQALISTLQHKYQPGDIVQGEKGPYKILDLEATQYAPEDVAMIKAGKPLPPIKERKQRPYTPAYRVQGPDGSQFTMAEWGINHKFEGPRITDNRIPLTNEDAQIFERNGERGLGEQMDHAESHERDLDIMKDPPEMAEGGSFDPIESARQRAYGSSSPGSPGVSGAIKDAINALRSYLLGTTQNEVAEGKRQIIDSATEDHADGGTVEGPSTEHEKAGLGKRFGVRVMEQAYGLDSSGKPALGGRAWTEGQGGTPMGILDEITAAPHNLLSLARTVRGLDPLRKRLGDPGLEERMFDAVDPQWSKDAADRLERLRQGMNQEFNVSDAHSLPEHMTDAGASLITPIPMTKAGEQAGLLKRVLEMTTPLRPRTVKNFATDTAVLGGIGTGIDALTDRLAKLRSQTAGSPGGGTPVDPANFSRDMGLSEDRPIHNDHQMVPLVDDHGNIYGYGVSPESF